MDCQGVLYFTPPILELKRRRIVSGAEYRR
jgi:hypothetical protein